MTFFLDTDICVHLLRGEPVRQERFRRHAEETRLSAIAYAELQFGLARSTRRARNRERLEALCRGLEIVPFDEDAAAHYGEIRQELSRRGELIGANDLLIAAHARSWDATLVTNNEREFARVPGLRIENWLRPREAPQTHDERSSSMTIAEGFAAEFQTEAAATRKFLERFEEQHADWQPHEKSMSLSRLASHLVEAPDWAFSILDSDEFDFGTSGYQSPHWKTRDDLLANHERIGAGFLKVLEGRSDDFMRAPWRLLLNGQVLEDTVRDAAIRNFIVSHLIHHRGQLSVYYRLLGIPVPGPYGPSADDQDG